MAGSAPPLQDRVGAYGRAWSREIGGLADEDAQIAHFREGLPRLLRDRPLIRALLEEIHAGAAYPDTRRAGFFENEVLLYMDDRRRFSLRLYFHAGGEYTVIHDHNAWGVSGVASGRLGVVRYRMAAADGEADSPEGEDAEPARLVQLGHRILPAGEVAVTRPLAPGIHQTGNPDALPNIMITVYGRPARRLYIREYDPVTHRAFKRYHPRIRKQRFAGDVLKTL